uniref:Uncharacterized protein n=1 Tax=Cuerna arida TaxID=1464854 RepID=A0A1B6FKP8_9HEMI
MCLVHWLASEIFSLYSQRAKSRTSAAMGLIAFVVVNAVGYVVLFVPWIAPFILPLLGFNGGGVAAGGLAAGAQAWMGGHIAAGCIFAKLQALAMLLPIP